MTPETRSIRNCGKPRGRTGPRSRAGKTSVRHNRWRHGLDAAPSLHPDLSAEIERLASALADERDPLVRAHAARAAEAELSILRVRQAKISAIKTVWKERANARRGAALIKLAVQVIGPPGVRKAPTPSRVTNWMRDLAAINAVDGPDSGAAAFAGALPELLKLDRYERRALSRRRRAVTVLVAARLLADAQSRSPVHAEAGTGT